MDYDAWAVTPGLYAELLQDFLHDGKYSIKRATYRVLIYKKIDIDKKRKHRHMFIDLCAHWCMLMLYKKQIKLLFNI